MVSERGCTRPGARRHPRLYVLQPGVTAWRRLPSAPANRSSPPPVRRTVSRSFLRRPLVLRLPERARAKRVAARLRGRPVLVSLLTPEQRKARPVLHAPRAQPRPPSARGGQSVRDPDRPEARTSSRLGSPRFVAVEPARPPR